MALESLGEVPAADDPLPQPGRARPGGEPGRCTSTRPRTRSWRGWARPSPRCCLDGSEARVAHVGDSRAYLFRDGELSMITEDHTLVQRMVREGS